MAADAPVIREDIKDKKDGAHGTRKHYNHIFNWQAGDKAATDAAFAKAEVTIKEMIVYPRVHPCPLETCQCVASFDKIKGELTLWGTFQAPHVIRTVGSLISKIPEHKIHVIAPDIGGGFGNKVGAYPGYICAIVASIVTGRPVKWVEDRIENLSTTAFARDFFMETEIAATQRRQGDRPALLHHRRPRRVRCLRQRHQMAGRPVQHHQRLIRLPRRARTRSTASTPTRRRAASPIAARSASPRPPTRSSAPWTSWRRSSSMDPAEFRMKNLIRREQFPYTSAFGWDYDSGDYHTAMNKAMETVGLQETARGAESQAQDAFKRGETRELMGIGVAFFTEIVGAGPSRNCDILGIAMFDSAEIRIHPTGSGICRLGTKSQGQGHETTYAQIIATELGLPADNIMVEEGNTDTAPYGLGTYGSRSTPVSGAATAMACRKIKAKAQMIAAYMLEVHDDDLEWDVDRFRVKGNPERFKTMTELAWAAYHEVPPGMEPGLEAINYYDPPNFTYPFGAYICVMDVDVDTGVDQSAPVLCARRLRHAHQSDDHRGPDPRRTDRSFRHRDGPGNPLRRGWQRDHRVVDGLFPADRGRDPEMGDRLDHDAVAAPSDRRQRSRRKPERRRRAVLLQRGERRFCVPRFDQYRDAARQLAHVDGSRQTRSASVSTACRRRVQFAALGGTIPGAAMPI